MRPEASRKHALKRTYKKVATKIVKSSLFGPFWEGAGGAMDPHFASFFQPSAALGTKMAPGALLGAPRAHPGLDFHYF